MFLENKTKTKSKNDVHLRNYKPLVKFVSAMVLSTWQTLEPPEDWILSTAVTGYFDCFHWSQTPTHSGWCLSLKWSRTLIHSLNCVPVDSWESHAALFQNLDLGSTAPDLVITTNSHFS